MNTPAIQVKLTLPEELYLQIQTKSKTLGIGLATYVKHLIITDVKESIYPVKQASARTEASYKRAIKAQQEGKLIRVDDIDKFFDSL